METTLFSAHTDQSIHPDVTAMNEAVICSQTLYCLADSTLSIALNLEQAEELRWKNLREAFASYQKERLKPEDINQATMQELVECLNAIGATPTDLICILRNLKASGALPTKLDSI